MTPSRATTLKSVIAAAGSLTGSELAAYLRKACGSDEALLADAQRLASAGRAAAGFLERPALHAVGLATIAASAEPLQPGERLWDRYVIERQLGEGTFGLAYAARDEQLAGRRVVIKTLPGTGDKSGMHFRREMEALARLDHPGIVGVYDAGVTQGGFFLVTQFVPGETLRHALRKGPLYPARAIRLIRQLAAAVDYAHAVSVCHYDLKPENIVLREANTPEERAVIIDFGLSAADASPEAGSWSYMAPEQRAGGGGPASDLYALGVIAIELLTGRSALPDAFATVPRAVEVVLSRATSHDPAARFATAAEFVEALAASLRPERGPWVVSAVVAAILVFLLTAIALIGWL